MVIERKARREKGIRIEWRSARVRKNVKKGKVDRQKGNYFD